MSPDSISIKASATANIAIGYLRLANLCASPFLLSMKHAAYMALSSLLLDFECVLPAGPQLAASCAAALSFADVCAARVLVAIGVVCMGGVGVVNVCCRRFRAVVTFENAGQKTHSVTHSDADTLGSVCSVVCTFGTDICGVVNDTLGSGCFISSVSLNALIRSLIILTLEMWWRI